MILHRIRAVALMVVNPHGDVLTLQEFVAKPHVGKYPGMFSIPMETRRLGEDDRAALKRLVEEELPGLDADLEVSDRPIGVYRIVPHVWVKLYLAQMARDTLPCQREDMDVGNHAWRTLEEATTLWLRQGALEMLTDYQQGLSGVIRRRCGTASPEPPQPAGLF